MFCSDQRCTGILAKRKCAPRAHNQEIQCCEIRQNQSFVRSNWMKKMLRCSIVSAIFILILCDFIVSALKTIKETPREITNANSNHFRREKVSCFLEFFTVFFSSYFSFSVSFLPPPLYHTVWIIQWFLCVCVCVCLCAQTFVYNIFL